MAHEERRLAEIAHGYIEDLRQRSADLRELIVLLEKYGAAKLDGLSEWFPMNDAEEWLHHDQADRLKELLAKL